MSALRSCFCCGLTQALPPVSANHRLCCARCGTTLADPRRRRAGNSRTAALAATALILYVPAVTLPMVTISRFGHEHDAGLLEGVVSMLTRGHVWIGIIVLVCSVVLPLAKLLAIFVLSAGGLFLRHEHKALTYRFVEWTGRWGMLDVLLVAILVAAVKIGDLVQVTAGAGALVFAGVVVLSLLASASFDPHSLWETEGDD